MSKQFFRAEIQYDNNMGGDLTKIRFTYLKTNQATI